MVQCRGPNREEKEGVEDIGTVEVRGREVEIETTEEERLQEAEECGTGGFGQARK